MTKQMVKEYSSKTTEANFKEHLLMTSRMVLVLKNGEMELSMKVNIKMD